MAQKESSCYGQGVSAAASRLTVLRKDEPAVAIIVTALLWEMGNIGLYG